MQLESPGGVLVMTAAIQPSIKMPNNQRNNVALRRSDYLAALEKGAETGLLDLSIIDTFTYEESLTRAIVSALAGGNAKEALDKAAGEWNDLTDEIGVDDQRAAYEDWAAKPGAYPN